MLFIFFNRMKKFGWAGLRLFGRRLFYRHMLQQLTDSQIADSIYAQSCGAGFVDLFRRVFLIEAQNSPDLAVVDEAESPADDCPHHLLDCRPQLAGSESEQRIVLHGSLPRSQVLGLG